MYLQKIKQPVFLKTVITENAKPIYAKTDTETIDLVVWDAEEIINDFCESVDNINKIGSNEDIFRNLPFEDGDID